jgi:Bifunctional DNA primase/polymerase, N-terminal
MTARTMHQIYEQEFHPPMPTSWRDYLSSKWRKEISFYVEEGFWLIPIQYHNKVPLPDYHWTEEKPLTREQAGAFCCGDTKRKNLALVVTSKGKLIVADCDTQDIGEEWLHRTLTMQTPRGFAFILEGKITREKLRAAGLPVESVRGTGDPQYQLLPLSETCSEKECPGFEFTQRYHDHDLHVREWIEPKKKILSVEEFLR